MKADASCLPARCETPAPLHDGQTWLAAVLETLGTAMLVLDVMARVRYANAAAGRLLGLDGPLHLRDGCLVAVPPHPRDAIRELVAHSLAVGRSQGAMLRNRWSREGVWVLATPLSGDAGFVLLKLAAPWEQTPTDIHLVRQALGLTIAEARVACALAEGTTAEEYAGQTGVSLSTVRTQIRAILEKAGLHRQSDLVRLVTRISTLVPARLAGIRALPKQMAAPAAAGNLVAKQPHAAALQPGSV